MSSDDGIATVRSFPFAQGRALGLKVEFLRRSESSVLLSPPRPILVEPRCALISLRVFARNVPHRLSIIVVDYYGQAYELPLGRLDYTGWKRLQAYVPLGVKQDDRHFAQAPGLRIAGLKIDFDPEEAYGSFYAYFDDIEATIDGLGQGEAVEAAGTADAAPTAAARPAAAPSAAPAPQGAAAAQDTAAAGTRILAELSRRIEAGLVYPAAARRRGLEGTLVAVFSVDAGGALEWARAERSSGSDILDAAGLDLLKGVFPVENDSGRRLELKIAIGYRLR